MFWATESGYALVNGLSFGCLFAYVAGSPLVLIDVLGVSTQDAATIERAARTST